MLYDVYNFLRGRQQHAGIKTQPYVTCPLARCRLDQASAARRWQRSASCTWRMRPGLTLSCPRLPDSSRSSPLDAMSNPAPACILLVLQCQPQVLDYYSSAIISYEGWITNYGCTYVCLCPSPVRSDPDPPRTSSLVSTWPPASQRPPNWRRKGTSHSPGVDLPSTIQKGSNSD